jgi:hypothetical protein
MSAAEGWDLPSRGSASPYSIREQAAGKAHGTSQSSRNLLHPKAWVNPRFSSRRKFLRWYTCCTDFRCSAYLTYRREWNRGQMIQPTAGKSPLFQVKVRKRSSSSLLEAAVAALPESRDTRQAVPLGPPRQQSAFETYPCFRPFSGSLNPESHSSRSNFSLEKGYSPCPESKIHSSTLPLSTEVAISSAYPTS